ncbi:HNH endonuclease [Methanolobus sp. ZRKC2]|uniref:HNH endonuclease n=1 Tax=Methanolobus sp. ZRKC2 TaxID=3125783 RepID=UPI00325063C8
MSIMFVVGQIYKRSHLHDEYGGNRQSGIAPSKKADLVFLFTGPSGKEHGYEDGWESNDVFYYTGEGQIGDMKFERGNKAIRDHFSNGKSLYLFEQSGKGHVKFLSKMKFIDYLEKEGFDRKKNRRKIIVFELQSV